MKKKKAIKIATASVLTASSFAAVAPFTTEAAVNVSSYVSQAANQMKKAQDTYAVPAVKGQAVSAAAVQKEVDLASKYYASAKSVISKYAGKQSSYYYSKLAAAMPYYNNAVGYIKAKTIAEGLNAQAAQVDKAVQAKDADTVNKLLPALNNGLKTAEANIRKFAVGAATQRVIISTLSYPKQVAAQAADFLGKNADKEAPVIKYDGPATVNVDNGADYKVPVLTATDNVDKDVKVTSVIKDAKGNVLDKIDTTVAGTYTVTYSAKDAAGNAAKDVVITVNVADATPAVTGVSAINAKQLQVTFNKAIDPATVITPTGSDANTGTLISTVFTKNGAPLTGSASLSSDGKTLTINVTGNTNGNYLFGYADASGAAIQTTDGKELGSYYKAVSANDTKAPTLVSTTTVDAADATVDFSEPIQSAGSLKATLPDGTDVTSYVTTSVSGNSINVGLSDANIPTGKNITLTFTGVTDFAGNLVSPNPVTAVVQKGAADGVAPYVTSVTPVNTKKFTVKFSEQVQNFTAADVSVTGGANVTGVTQDATDKTLYVVTLDAPVSGLQTVTVGAGYNDLSGQAAASSVSKIVNFGTDTTAPTASAVVTKDSNGKEVLKFTTSEETTFNGTGIITLTNAKQVYNYVTTTGSLTFAASDVTAVANTNNQYTVPLSAVQFNGQALVSGASYTADIVAGLFKDTAGLTSTLQSGALTFTRGTDADTTKPTVDTTFGTNGVNVVDNNTLQVKFVGNLDGASAINPANYNVSGASVSSVSLGANNVVTINLAKDSVTTSGLRAVTVSGVKNTSGVVMDTFTVNENLTENVRPTISSVAVTSLTGGNSVITLTASEALNLHNAAGENTQDFDLYIGGVKDTSATAIATSAGTGNQIVVTITGKQLTADDFAKGVQLRPESTIDITDTKGNALNTGNITVNLQ
jgi:hypothetical protein